MADEKRKNLGRGLSALLGEDTQDYAQLDRLRASKAVPIEFIQPGKYQPRHRVDDEALKDLTQSIAEKGILQPILVRRKDGQANVYEIIAGERRWRAAQRAGLHEVPVVIKDLTDQETLEIALVENLQRQDLTPLEEAEGYRRLMDEFSHTQEKLSQAVGKSRSHVANMMRLLSLPDPVKELMQTGQLTAGHARALLSAPNPIVLAREIVAKGLNVRQAEALAQGRPNAKPAAATPHAPVKKDADTLALERDLAALLGLKVEIRFHGGGGTLSIHYTSLDQLDDILNRLSQGGPRMPDAAQGSAAGGSVPAAKLSATASSSAKKPDDKSAPPKPPLPKPTPPKPAATPTPAPAAKPAASTPPPKPAAVKTDGAAASKAPPPKPAESAKPGAPATAATAAKTPPKPEVGGAPKAPPKPNAPGPAPIGVPPSESAGKGAEKKNSAAPLGT